MFFDLQLKGETKDVKAAIRGLGKILRGVPGDEYMGVHSFTLSCQNPHICIDRVVQVLETYSVAFMLTTPNNDSKRSFYRILRNSKGKVKITKKATRRVGLE
jgi:hypothetical protein